MSDKPAAQNALYLLRGRSDSGSRRENRVTDNKRKSNRQNKKRPPRKILLSAEALFWRPYFWEIILCGREIPGLIMPG